MYVCMHNHIIMHGDLPPAARPALRARVYRGRLMMSTAGLSVENKGTNNQFADRPVVRFQF